MIRDVTDLEIYNLSLGLLPEVYALTSSLSFDYRKLKLQLNGAAEAIAPLIAEGFGKKKAPKEFCRFLLMALGSSDEVITHIRKVRIANVYSKLGISEDECIQLIAKYQMLSKKINKLHSAWEKFSL